MLQIRLWRRRKTEILKGKPLLPMKAPVPWGLKCTKEVHNLLKFIIGETIYLKIAMLHINEFFNDFIL